MRVLLDTSVLVGAVLRSHPRHADCRPWLDRARADEIDLVLGAHSLAELYSVLTRIPARPRISPDKALRLIREAILELPSGSIVEISALSPDDYLSVLRDAADTDLAGGIIYDKLIARCAEIAEVDTLVTMNAKHFRRAWPAGRDKIRQP